jgi:hypothetical protein
MTAMDERPEPGQIVLGPDGRLREARACAFCGEGFVGRRGDARYCSDAHKQAAYRARSRNSGASAVTATVARACGHRRGSDSR